MNLPLLISLIFGGVQILRTEAWQGIFPISLKSRRSLSNRHILPADVATFSFSATSSALQSSKHSDSMPQFQQPKHSPKKQPGSKFGQPRFAQANNNNPNSQKKHIKDPNKFGADSAIASRHAERLKTAGREGTKRYQDPNKVFLGNLNFTVTDEDLQQFLTEEFALPGPLLLKQCKVVKDWKTQQSKGYAFAVFSEPIYATVCLEKLDGKSYRGRKLRVQPGYKAAPDPQIYIEQKRQKRLAREAAGLLDDPEEEEPMMDPVEAMMLRKLDPDLVDEDRVLSWDANDDEDDKTQGLVEVESYEFDDDDELFDEFDPDDDESGVDGYWFGDEEEESDLVEFDESETLKNRQQRRQESRKKKKKKSSDKGFG